MAGSILGRVARRAHEDGQLPGCRKRLRAVVSSPIAAWEVNRRSEVGRSRLDEFSNQQRSLVMSPIIDVSGAGAVRVCAQRRGHRNPILMMIGDVFPDQ